MAALRYAVADLTNGVPTEHAVCFASKGSGRAARMGRRPVPIHGMLRKLLCNNVFKLIRSRLLVAGPPSQEFGVGVGGAVIVLRTRGIRPAGPSAGCGAATANENVAAVWSVSRPQVPSTCMFDA